MTDRENAGDEECIRNLLRTPARSASDDKGLESECMESPTPLESNMQQIQLLDARHVFFARDGAVAGGVGGRMASAIHANMQRPMRSRRTLGRKEFL